jgi:hypothetical protein
VGQTLATIRNHVKYPADISSASTALRRCALPWARGLQQDSFCSARMQNHRTRETRKAVSLGSSRASWILTWSRSKCIHLDNGQRTHRGYSRILSPQLSNATVIIHRPVTNGGQRHDGRLPESSSRRPLRQRRGWHHRRPHGFSSNFQTQITTSSVPHNPSFVCQSRSTLKPHSLINPNFELADAQQAANEITDDNSDSRHPQCAITSEGGHTSDTPPITSEGAHWLPETLTPQHVSR